MATKELITTFHDDDLSSLFEVEPLFGRRSTTPWQWMERVQNELNDSWRHWGSTATPRALPDTGAWSPSIDIREGVKHWTVEVDLPGVVKDDIDVEIRGNALVINAEMKHEEEIKEEKYYRRERKSGRFYRLLALPDGVDTAKVSCNFSKGVLTCRLPKTETAVKRSHKVPIGGS